MIGQTSLIQEIDKFDFQSFPKASMLIGENGCGKHTVLGMLSTKFNLTPENISNKLSYSDIEKIYLRTTPALYWVDEGIGLKEQNSLLKFLEDTPELVRVVVIASSEDSFLETIYARCYKFKFVPYTKDELKEFTTDSTILSVCNTPGQVIELKENAEQEINLCDTILTKSAFASIPNILTVYNRFSKDKNGFNIDLFMRLLLSRIKEYIIKGLDYSKVYSATIGAITDMQIRNADKQKIFDLYLLQIKSILRSQS